MEKEFVPYALAVELKELGFDEPCLAISNGDKLFYGEFKSTHEYYKENGLILYQQVFRWFREKYDLVSWVRRRPGFVKEYSWYVSDFNDEDPDEYYFDLHIETYEEAELECLKKLIEIVKEKK